MSLTQIDLRTEYKHPKQLEFNPESWCISELYWSKLKDYNTEKVKKCNIIVSDSWKEEQLYQYTNWSDAKGINMPFDFAHYFQASKHEKKKRQLQVLFEGMSRIAEIEGWEKDPLMDAYNDCLASDLIYQFDVGKPKLSPDRKHKIGFWCNWDIDGFELYWVLYNTKENEIKRKKLLERAPQFGEFVYYLKWKWIDKTVVLLEDKFKYGKNESWKIFIDD